MKIKFLKPKGISSTHAQSLSNLANQKAEMLLNKINSLNSCGKTVKLNGDDLVLQEPKSIPGPDLIVLVEKISKYRAFQAFLMEGIKEKEQYVSFLRSRQLKFEPRPSYPELIDEDDILQSFVPDSYGWEELTPQEVFEFTKNEAYASVIGKLIHKNTKIDLLRKEVASLVPLEFMEIEDGKKSPVTNKPNWSDEELLTIHEKLSDLHRKYESSVNFIKQKVKNIVFLKNQEISKANNEALAESTDKNLKTLEEHKLKLEDWSDRKKKAELEFLQQQEMEVKQAFELKIEIPELFKDVYDELFDKV